ncbi:hypothetical protein Pmani_003892 [Petrolisthes manimaculis]|uniref:Uncharacterized protein n=1 Tax=Petrolisthes manimaculis TaxID=1843537 RepID=A0AAE1QES6_9EUCA|nr:hypothetical protein Pmani_003892 [Petrolisthes manimaculis]
MNLQRRWEFLRKAMRRVVVYDVRDHSHVGVITFNTVAHTVAPITYIESEDSDFRQRVGPSAVPESQKCLLCGLQEAERLLSADPKGSDGVTIILITTGSGQIPQRQMDEIIRIAQHRNMKIEVVLYPLSERRGAAATSHGLETLMEATRGSLFTVMDEGVGNDSKVKMMVALMDALLAAVQQNTPPSASGTTVLVHNAAYPGGISSMSAGTFALDDSLGPNARFSVYYYDLNHVGNAIQLTAPSGQTIAAVNVQEEDGDVNMIFINLEKAEVSLILCLIKAEVSLLLCLRQSVENRADSHQELYVQITAKRNSSSGLVVRLWTSTGSRPINSSDPSSPVVVYVEVKGGVAPIMDAKVVARLQRRGTNDTGTNYEPLNLHLWDNGIGGGRDILTLPASSVWQTWTLPPLSGKPGRYLLSADVDYNSGLAVVAKSPPSRHHKLKSHYYQQGHDSWGSEQSCCGSSLPHVHTRCASPFFRHVTLGVLEVMSPVPFMDVTPPSRILDLRVEVNDTIHQITLSWTAPGDDWDVGKAYKYEAVVAPLWKEARAFQGNRLTGLPQPLSAGTLHTTNLHFPRYEELWYISVRAIDEAGNVGGLGNIAALWVPRPPTTYEITTRTQPALTTSGNYTMPSELGSGRPVGFSELQLEDVAVILGSLGGFLLVVAALVAYCYCHTSRRKKQQHEKDVEKVAASDGSSVMVKSGSLGGEDGGGGSHESLDSIVKEALESVRNGRPLSPVQS